MQTKRVNWALDADINGFFDTVDHAWLMQFLEHRSRRQRAVIPPLLANINLHYVFDLWAQQWRGRHANADVIDRCAAMAGARVIGVQPRRHRVHAGEDLEDHRRPRADRVDPEAARRRSTVERIARRAPRVRRLRVHEAGREEGHGEGWQALHLLGRLDSLAPRM